jgi:hypothetical protein
VGAVTEDQVWAELGQTGSATGPDLAHLQLTVAAVNAYVNALPHVTAADPWPGDVQLGATMLGARWYQKRASPNGVVDYTEFGAAQVLRYDPDVGRLLGIDKFSPGAVA